MQVEAIQWKSGQPLTEDYIHRFDQVSGLFDYNPWKADDWKQRAAWLDKERPDGADREALSEALIRFNSAIGGSEATIRHAELLKDRRTLCIVGGQQASLFTGPLLVVYKAITLIQAARHASSELQRPVIPVFWIAGEDHDFDEVNHFHYLSSDMKVEKVKLDHPTGLRTSVSQTAISREQWEEALASMEQALMPTEFRAELMASLRGMADASATLVEYFARIMAKLFGAYGLVFVDSDDPHIRRLEAPMFRQLVERSDEIHGELLKGKARILSGSYQPQAELHDRGANLFVYDGGERILLYPAEDGNGFTDRRGERRYSREQLAELAESSPERLSNNVMTRPLMQDYLFPVLGAVLGRAEIAYWGLTREAFHLLGMRMPLLLPRLEFTLLEGTVQKNMRKFDLSLEDALFRLEERQQDWLKEQDQFHLEERFGEVKSRFKDSYEPLVEAIGAINPGLRKLGETNLGKIIEQIDFLQQKSEDGLRSQFDAGIRQFERIGMSLVPGGKPQERVFNIASYMNKYGEGWLKELLELPLVPDGKHRVCYI
ncbi:Putative cysteine ligase BshC [Paenibacillus solanacearum]|uniref:Putative cysteine ligase BshC n=1 Tax=Paenibacillus solanacearum TaxID=2048548 RepID=A0A916JUZ5_9BACL|nr:bacillithiol biosynthesis cysteine-adding enzyme BshC [Paenibacillus solanacearum]CAG7605694.1 Putative cysteine ligase BshC [Paenibacillus solanacearum]